MNIFSPRQHRVVALDVLRGFALLGILLMNIQSFSMPGAAYLNPTAFGDLEGPNYLVWVLSHIFADQKFMSLFSMLFGVGILLFSQSIEAKGLRATALHYRRTFWLLMFGLLHGYLFWYGDILFSYAMCGLWVYWFKNRSVKALIALGIIFIGISSMLDIATGLSIPHIPPEATSGMSQSWQPTQEHINKEITEYTASWLSAFEHRIDATFFMQTYVFLNTFVWRAGGMMLIGMGLYKSGFFTLTFSTRRYAQLAISAMIPGLTIVLIGLHLNHQNGFSLEFSMFLGNQFNYWGSILVAMAYAALCMIMVKQKWLPDFQSILASVGRTAFSQYILQTLICTTLFYSLGLFATFSRTQQLLLVLLIWTIQLIIAPLWLKRFKFGPMEWLWRSLTYWQFQPMRITNETKNYNSVNESN